MSYRMPASYDRWLEAPYQERHEEADRRQHAREELADDDRWEPCYQTWCHDDEPCDECVDDRIELWAKNAALQRAGID